MSCQHLHMSPLKLESHVLPCKHSFCIPCIESIQGLMQAEIFQCPICGNFSQYREPQVAVYGPKGLPNRRGERRIYNLSGDISIRSGKDSREERTRFIPSIGKVCNEPTDDSTARMDKSAFPSEKGGARAQVQMVKELKGTPTVHGSTSLTSQMTMLATNDTKKSSYTPVVETQCKYHSFPYILYCETCRRMLCRVCFEEHVQNCVLSKPASLRDMKKRMLSKFQYHIQKVDDRKKNFVQVSSTAERNLDCLEEESNALKEKVRKATKQAIAQLIENEELMVKQIDAVVKKKTATQQACSNRANEIIDSWNKIGEAAQNALESVEASDFVAAQIKEDDVNGRIKDMEWRYSHTSSEPYEKIALQCEIKRIAKYSENDGDQSEPPVRLNKPTSSEGVSSYTSFYA